MTAVGCQPGLAHGASNARHSQRMSAPHQMLHPGRVDVRNAHGPSCSRMGIGLAEELELDAAGVVAGLGGNWHGLRRTLTVTQTVTLAIAEQASSGSSGQGNTGWQH